MAANVEVLGLAEAGYALEDFATAEGNRVPVTTEEETPLYVAGTAALADESLGEVAEERIAESGEGGWKDVVGHAQMRSENDVGKEIYVKSINPGTWIGPLAVVMAFPPDRLLEKVQNKQVVALDKGVGKRIGLMKYGQTKDVEVSWGGPPDDGMGPAQEAGSPEMRLDTTGGTGARATSFSPGRRPSASDSFALRGASVGSAARMSGLSETAVSNELQGRVDMDVGARDVVGGAIERTKGERAAWVMAAQTASQPSITIPDFDWSGLPQVIGGYNYNWDDYYNQYGGGGYDDPYGGEVPPTIQTAEEQWSNYLSQFDEEVTDLDYTYTGPQGTVDHWANDVIEGRTELSYFDWVMTRRGPEWGIEYSSDQYTQDMKNAYMALLANAEAEGLSDEDILNSAAYLEFMAEWGETSQAELHAKQQQIDEDAASAASLEDGAEEEPTYNYASEKSGAWAGSDLLASVIAQFGDNPDDPNSAIDGNGNIKNWALQWMEQQTGMTQEEIWEWQGSLRAEADAYVQQAADQGHAAAAAQAQAEARAAYQHWQEQQDKAEKARKRRAAPEYVEDIEEWAEENPHKMEEEQRKEEADAGFLAKPEYMEDMPKEEWMAHYGHRYGV